MTAMILTPKVHVTHYGTDGKTPACGQRGIVDVVTNPRLVCCSRCVAILDEKMFDRPRIGTTFEKE